MAVSLGRPLMMQNGVAGPRRLVKYRTDELRYTDDVSSLLGNWPGALSKCILLMLELLVLSCNSIWQWSC